MKFGSPVAKVICQSQRVAGNVPSLATGNSCPRNGDGTSADESFIIHLQVTTSIHLLRVNCLNAPDDESRGKKGPKLGQNYINYCPIT